MSTSVQSHSTVRQTDILQKIAASIPGVIYQFQIAPDGTWRFPYASPGIQDIYGFSPEACNANPMVVLDVIDPEDFDAVMKSIHASGETMTPWHQVYRVHHPERGMIWVEADSIPEKDDSGAITWYGYIREITASVLKDQEKEKLREELAEAQKMETLGRMAGGVAHDFNNLLQAIGGFAGLVEERASSEADVSDLGEIQKAVRQASSLTRQLLAFSRKQHLYPRTLNLNMLVKDSRRMIERTVGDNMEVRIHAHEKPLPVHVDAEQLRNVLMNLVINARDAMDGEGALIVRTGESEPDACPELAEKAEADLEGWAWMEVADTGCGISPAERALIFEPFYSTKNLAEKAGLGLATCQGIVQQHGGTITVRSEVGEGSAFRVWVPLSQQEEQPLEHVQSKLLGDSDSKIVSVLLVEDEPAVRDFLARLLEARGYHVLKAANGEEARERAPAADIILSDVILPDANGIELVKEFRSAFPHQKQVLMSGYSQAESASDRTSKYGVPFLNKPFTRHDLFAALES